MIIAISKNSVNSVSNIRLYFTYVCLYLTQSYILRKNFYMNVWFFKFLSLAALFTMYW
jgi:hypothetical protein